MKSSITLLIATLAILQNGNTQYLQDKYWNYKHRLHSNFIRIGKELGQSIPASSRSIGSAYYNAPAIDGLNPSRIYFTDATIYLGHYLSVLASEYRIQVGSLEESNSVLHEIYYAIQAINRLDNMAESYLAHTAVNTTPEDLNGFLLRDDVPKDHYLQYQEDFSPVFQRPAYLIKSHSDYDPLFIYDNFTYTGFNWSEHSSVELATDVLPNYDFGINKGNVMSQDQVITLLTGLRSVYDFVDFPGMVQPTPNDVALNIKAEARAIVERILKYIIRPNPQCANCFDFVILGPDGNDVHTGADMTLYAPMLLKLAEHFSIDLGIPSLLTFDVGPFATLSIKKPNETTQNTIAATLGLCGLEFSHHLNQIDGNKLVIAKIPILTLSVILHNLEEENTQLVINDLSALCVYPTPELILALFEIKYGIPGMLCDQPLGAILQLISDYSFANWSLLTPFHNFLHELYDLGVLSESDYMSNQGTIYCAPEWEVLSQAVKEDNIHMLIEMAVASGFWTQEYIQQVSQSNGFYNYTLLNSVFSGDELVDEVVIKNELQAILEAAPCTGPYGDPLGSQTSGVAEWRSQNRLFHVNNRNDGINETSFRGEYSGLDYMFLYNAFHLKWRNQLPPYKRVLSCECVEEITTATELQEDLQVNMKFRDYREKGIPIESFLAHSISTQSRIDVDNDLIVCRALETDPTIVSLQQGSSLVLKDGNTLTVREGNKIVASELSTIVLGAEGSFEGSTTTVFEAGAELNLYNGSVLEVNRGSNLIFRDGAKLRMEDMSRISVDNTSSIRFEDGAQLIYNGGFVELNDWDARIVLNKGQIVVKQDKVFSITSDPFVSSGLIKIEAATSAFPSFVVGQDATLSLTGESEQDLILHSEPNCQIVVHGTSSSSFVFMKKGKVDLGENTVLSTDADLWAEHVDFTAGENGSAMLFGSKINLDVVSCSWTRASVSTFRSKVKVFSSSFYHTGQESMELTGGSFEVFKSSFDGGGIYSSGLEYASRISGSSFNLQNDQFNVAQNALEDESMVEIRIKDCYFQKCDHALLKTGGMLTVACSNFYRCDYGVFGNEGCTVNLTDKFAGYNTFESGEINIGLKNAQDLLLYYGFNNFLSYSVANIVGTLNRECNSELCNGGWLDASGNQWPSSTPSANESNGDFALEPGAGGSVNTGPDPNAHLVYTSGEIPSECLWLDPNNSTNNACQIFIGASEYFTSSKPCAIEEPYIFKPERRNWSNSGEIALHQLRDLQTNTNFDDVVLSSPVFQGFSLDSALHAAASHMTYYQDSLGNDEYALSLFQNILNDTVLLNSPNKSSLGLAGIQHMKTCFENLAALDTTGMAEVKFNAPYVASYLEVLNMYTDTTVSEANYHSQINIETYKGQFLYTLGLPHEANEVFQHLSDCPVDSLEQSMLNHWRELLDKVDTLGAQLNANVALDSLVLDVDTTQYVQAIPISTAEFNFGVYIHGPHDLEFFNCSGVHQHRVLSTGLSSISVYPNPTMANFTISSQGGNFENVVIFDLTGRKIFELSPRQPQNQLILDAAILGSPGIYSVRVWSGGEWRETKLVYQR